MSLPSRWLAPARRRAVVAIALCAAMLGTVPLAQADVADGSAPTAQVTEQPSEAATEAGAMPESPETVPAEAPQVEGSTATDPQTESPSTDQPGASSGPTTQSVAPEAEVTYLDRTGWTATASSQETVREPGAASRAIDGDAATHWHSRYDGTPVPMPHTLTLDLGAEQRVGGLRYQPRSSSTANGNIKRYEIHTSLDGTRWTLAATGDFQNGPAATLVTFAGTTARHVRLTARSAHNGTAFAAAAEVDLVAAGPPVDFDAAPDRPSSYRELGLATDLTGETTHHGPALTVLNNGHLLAAYEQRSAPREGQAAASTVVQRRSTDNGQTWGEPTAALPVGAAGEEFTDPSFVVERATGTVFLFHTVRRADGTSHPGVVRSDDSGATWQRVTIAEDIAGDAGWRQRTVVSGRGVQLRYGPQAGRLVQQLVHGTGDAARAMSLYSDDRGTSWQVGSTVAGTSTGVSKTVELSDGRVMLNAADTLRGGYRKVAFSADGAQSFGDVAPDRELRSPVTNASLIRVLPNAAQGSADAKVLLHSTSGVTGPASGTVRMSCDDGETWPVAKHFEPGAMSASTMVTKPDGAIGMLFESGTGITYTDFSLAWLEGACASIAIADAEVDAGKSMTLAATITNQTPRALSAGTLELDLPWSSLVPTVPVAATASGQSTTASITTTVPTGTSPGEYRVVATLITPEGRAVTAFTVTVRAAQNDFVAIAPELVNPNPKDEYVVGDRLRYTYRVTNLTTRTIAVVPASTDLRDFSRPTTSVTPVPPNCGYQSLPAGTSYTCTTAYHVVTQADLDAGSFTPRTTWTVRADNYSGALLAGDIKRDGPAAVVKPPPDLIPQSRMSIEDFSSQNVSWEWQVASNAIDGRPETMWHNHWNLSGRPHHITLDLGHNYQVHTLRYLPRQTGNANGIFRDYAVYVSQDGRSWGPEVFRSTIAPNTRQVQVVPLQPKVGRYLKIVVTRSHGAVTGAASVAELNVQGKPIGAQITKRAFGSDGVEIPSAGGTGAAPLTHGTVVGWEYTVKNVGDTVLAEVEVTDTWTTPGGATGDVAVTCPKNTLAPGESMTCTGAAMPLVLDLFAPPAGSAP